MTLSPIAPQSAEKRASIAVLISGSGTTLVNLAGQAAAGILPVNIAGVISSRPTVAGVQRARQLGLPVEIVERRNFADSVAFSDRLLTVLSRWSPDLVCMAGFLCFWNIPSQFAGRVVNIHPSLLPKFGGQGMHGLKVHEAVLKAGEKISGCTVHLADNVYDHGPVLLQRTCPVLPHDSPQSLAARVFAEECIAYPQAIRQLLVERGLI